MDEKVVVYTYRYMWKCEGSDNVNFKIVSEPLEGIEEFEKALLNVEGIVRVSREYLHEYDVSKLGVFEKIFDKGDK